MRETARGSVEEVREIAHGLRPEALADFGLRAALATLGSTFAERTGLRVRSRLAPQLPELDRERELAIYRVAQESLTNVARHAWAHAVELELERRDGTLVLRVRDDGVGVDGPRSPRSPTGPAAGSAVCASARCWSAGGSRSARATRAEPRSG